MRELKEQGIIKVEWIATRDNSADLFTKNLQGPLFQRHANVYVSDINSMDSQRESVEEQNLSHRQLGTKNATRTETSIAEPEQNPENNIGLGGNMADSNRNNWEGQDLNQDQEEKSNEQWDSEKKSQEQCD